MSDISERHHEQDGWFSDETGGPVRDTVGCVECQTAWPCDTAIETARADKAEAGVERLAEAGYEAINGELGHAPDHCDCEPCRGWRAALDAIKEDEK